ncbi:MAG: winged helix-turn-helix domain-containing protein, partial [Pyrinomonadaceae bacterium]
MSLDPHEIFEFGEFRLDMGEFTVVRVDGRPTGHLPGKAFQVLVELLRRNGHLVSKEELIDAVWPGTNVEDNNVDKCIHQIRQFLGDSQNGNRHIDTVRKHGYRFVKKVVTLDAAGRQSEEKDDQHANADAEKQASLKLDPRDAGPISDVSWSVSPAFRLSAMATSAVLVIAAAYGLYQLSLVRVSGSAPRSIAILPLRPINSSQQDELYQIGIADSIINSLTGANGLTVRPLGSVRMYASLDTEPTAAGREQNVDFVLASNYQRADGRFRVTSQLIDIKTGAVEDTHKVETAAASIFEIQDVVAGELSARLLSRLGMGRKNRTARNGTISEQAYRLNLHGMNLLRKAGTENVARSIEALREAVGIDPNYAEAWAGLALAYFARSTTLRPQGTDYDSSMDAVNHTLNIDPNSSAAYSALCANRYRFEYDSQAAETACRRALELDPNSSDAHHVYALLLGS